jgi:hypothetical protein
VKNGTERNITGGKRLYATRERFIIFLQERSSKKNIFFFLSSEGDKEEGLAELQ